MKRILELWIDDDLDGSLMVQGDETEVTRAAITAIHLLNHLLAESAGIALLGPGEEKKPKLRLVEPGEES